MTLLGLAKTFAAPSLARNRKVALAGVEGAGSVARSWVVRCVLSCPSSRDGELPLLHAEDGGRGAESTTIGEAASTVTGGPVQFSSVVCREYSLCNGTP